MKALTFKVVSSALRHGVFAAAALLMFAPTKAKALEGLYIGGQLGNFALSDSLGKSYKDALGFGGDLGFKTTSMVDLVLSAFYSSHSGPLGGTKIFAPTINAEVHLGRAYDFDFTVGGGPGFYNFSNSLTSETKFGLNFGGAVDFLIDDSFRVGLGTRYHIPFNANTNIWAVTMRAGYLFTME